MGYTTIEWTEKTWNPVRGCKPVSPGCANCYAEDQAGRMSGPGGAYEGLVQLRPGRGFKWTGVFREVPEALDVPLGVRKPTTWFVNSMSDLFGEGVSDGFIDGVLATMLLSPRHTYQILTKRSERLPAYMAREDLYEGVLVAASELRRSRESLYRVGISNPALYPPPWIWWGVSVEDRKHGLPRIDDLRRTPAAVRFVSFEPLLEDLGDVDLTGIAWVIVGCESGPGARPMDENWVRSIRDQCIKKAVPFFYKQRLDARGRKVSQPELDGRAWSEMPEVHRAP